MDEFEDHIEFSHAEVTSTEVTAATRIVGQTTFSIVASKRTLMHDQFRIASVCVGIEGPDLSDGKLHVSVWDDRSFVYSSNLGSTSFSQLPIDLRGKLEDVTVDRVYYFEINIDLIATTWCSILTPHASDQKTECILRLKNFALL